MADGTPVPIARDDVAVAAGGDVVATPASSGRCRNCRALATGNYCPNCGQETMLELPSAGVFLREVAGRYISLDGRLWRSLRTLVVRPGFLTREYLAGRRRRYVRPARLFVASSIVLFAVLRVTVETPVIEVQDDRPAAGRISAAPKDSPARNPGVHLDRDLDLRFDVGDAIPALQPLRARVDAFNRLSRDEKVRQLLAGILRYAPYAAIGLLPLFALLLEIVYAGGRARHPSRPHRYAAHLVFGAHNHAFLFLAATVMAVVDAWPVRMTLGAWMVVYALASMRAVYGGSWLGIVLRACVIAFVYSVFFVLAMVGVVVAAVTFR